MQILSHVQKLIDTRQFVSSSKYGHSYRLKNQLDRTGGYFLIVPAMHLPGYNRVAAFWYSLKGFSLGFEIYSLIGWLILVDSNCIISFCKRKFKVFEFSYTLMMLEGYGRILSLGDRFLSQTVPKKYCYRQGVFSRTIL